MGNEIKPKVITDIITKGAERMKDQIKRAKGCEDTPLPKSLNGSESELQEIKFELSSKDEMLENFNSEDISVSSTSDSDSDTNSGSDTDSGSDLDQY